MSIVGQKIVVVGSAGDIGKVVCERIAESGGIVILGTRDKCDVTSTESVREFMRKSWSARPSEHLGGVVTCHGAPSCIKPTVDLTDEEFQKVIDVDLTGTMRVCREAARFMLTQKYGNIVNVSSMHAIATYPERAAYAAAKAGVVGLTRAMAVEWAKSGVRANCVLPGQVYETRRTGRLIEKESAPVFSRSPTGALVTADDIASAIIYLLSSSGVNGHSLVVDDGWTASAWFGSHA